ncbi:hypothetical protein GCM10011384_14280 [Psychrobacillus lasiicapitis]|nr:hypothetical protein GCM10011384_14280 [Psychrobacillus lasiicapitis]
MSTFLFVLILILIGILFIIFNNKLPNPITVFFSVFVIMCIIYAIQYIPMLINIFL